MCAARGIVEHVPRLEGVGDAERDPCADVGAQVRPDGPARPLGREHEVDTERPPLCRDPQQGRQELGQVVGQRAELVDHHDEPGQHAGRQDGDVGHAVGGEDTLAAAQLCPQPGERPRREPWLEVGDLTDDVRQSRARSEARSALEVHQHESQVGRRPGQGEPEHERLEQLRLARPGGAGDEQVRPVPDQVEAHGRAVGARAQRHCPAVGSLPARRERLWAGHLGEAVGPGQGYDGGQEGVFRRPGGRGAAEPGGAGQEAGQVLGPFGGDADERHGAGGAVRVR